MCRDFSDRPVPPEVVDRILDAARRAPSAGHAQGWAFVVLEGAAQVRRFWELDADPAWVAAPTLPGVLRAPVVVVPLCSPAAYLARYAEGDKAARGRPGGGVTGGTSSWEVPWWTVDVSFATMLLLLAAADEGLGALLLALHGEPARTLAGLGVPPGWEALGAVVLGWPAPGGGPAGSAARGRRPWDEVVHRGGWSPLRPPPGPAGPR